MNRNRNEKGKWIGKALVYAVVLLAAFFGTRKLLSAFSAGNSVIKRVVETDSGTDALSGGDAAGKADGIGRDGGSEIIVAAVDPDMSDVWHIESRYLLANLTPELQTDFAELYRSTVNFQNFCEFPVPISRDDTELLLTLLHTECPELFQLDSGQTSSMEIVGELALSVTIPYSMGKTQYDGELEQCKSIVAELAGFAQAGVFDYEKELIVYRKLCGMCSYDLTDPRAGNAAGVLLGGVGKCDGISLAYKWVMDELAIPCIVAAGENRQEGREGHAWNLVCTEGTWCTVDVTQDCDTENRSILCYPVFNSSSELLERDYRLQSGFEKLNVPVCGTVENSYHVRNDSYIRSGEEKTGFFKAMKRASEEGGASPVQFESAKGWKLFQENSAEWAREWMEENGVYGSSSYVAIEAFRTAEIKADLNENSGRMQEIDQALSGYEKQIEDAREDLDERKALLDEKENELESLRTRAEELSGLGMENWTEEQIDEYNVILEKHRELQESYRLEAEEYNSRVSVYQELYDTYNTLVTL